MKEKGCTYAVMEVSSHALDQCRVYDLDFETAIFTNLTQDHLDFFGNIENYKHLDAIYCYDISLNSFDFYGISMYDKNSIPFPIYYQIGEATMYPDFVKVDNIKYYK